MQNLCNTSVSNELLGNTSNTRNTAAEACICLPNDCYKMSLTTAIQPLNSTMLLKTKKSVKEQSTAYKSVFRRRLIKSPTKAICCSCFMRIFHLEGIFKCCIRHSCNVQVECGKKPPVATENCRTSATCDGRNSNVMTTIC